MKRNIVATCLLLLCAITVSAQAANTRPNILFIVADDLATRVGCYGDKAAITPNIDRLAKEGMCFDHAYVQGTVCTPSRTSFMLGLNNRSARRNHFVKNPDTMTMGRWFRQHGFQTFSVGKIDHGKAFVDPKAWEIRGVINDTPFSGLKVIREDQGKSRRRVSRYHVAESAETTRDWKVTEHAIQFIQKERDSERPFFAAVGFFKPHQPCVSTEAHFKRHDPQRFTLQPTPNDASPVGHVAYRPGLALSENTQRLAQRAYYASVSHMDEQLGRLIDALEVEGVLDNTLIVFTSDHGYHLGWRGQWAKHDLSEEVMRVPLVVRYPKLVHKGTRTNGIVELLDLFPTLAEFAGLTIPETLDGKSFLPQLKDPEAAGKSAAFCDNGVRGRTVRTLDWRLTQYINGDIELYHLPSDPSEYYNVFDHPQNGEVIKSLKKLLVAELGELSTPSKKIRRKNKNINTAAPVQRSKNPERRNVLFIGVDDLRPELNCYGATHIKSPNIDQLAKEGVLFERAYCQWAVCMPSRASLLTGLRPDTFKGKAAGWRKLLPDVVTLPQHFKNNGYFAQSFGKIYHGSWKTAYVGNAFQDPISWSVERWAASPQYYFSPAGMAEARKVFATASPKALFLRDAKRNPDNPDQWKEFFVRGFPTESPDVADNVPADGKIADAAIERLREVVARKKSPPFFLAVGFQKPHLPFVAPKKYWDLYDPQKIPPVPVPDRPKGAPDFAIKAGANEVNQYVRPTRGPVSPKQTRHLRHGYAACVSYVDAQIGRLLNELDTLGIRDNTIVVLWSDHGYKLGDFGSWAKHTNFEFDTRVPLIISVPGLPKGKRCEALVELVDLHPTLSELAGLSIHQGAEGESFAANVHDPNAAGQTAAFSQFPKGGRMGYTIRTATHRYTEWHNTKRKRDPVIRELYKYDKDRIERVNLAGKPKHTEIQESLRKRLAVQLLKGKKSALVNPK